MDRLHELYGRRPAHLLGVLAGFAVSAAALVHFVKSGPLVAVATWFAGAIVLHDLVLFPAYSLLDRRAARVVAATGAPASRINYLRVPTLFSGLLALVYFPLILGLGDVRYRKSTGMDTSPYLGRWLAVTAALFFGSALWWGVSTLRSR